MVMSIKESKEFILFEAFAKSSSFDSALEVIEAYDREKSHGKILSSSEDKLFLFESYKIFCETKRILSGKDGSFDYDDFQQLSELKNGISKRMPAISRTVFNEDTKSVTMMMANIGRMLDTHVQNLKTLGRKELAYQKRQAIEEDRRLCVMVEKHGKVNSGGYSGKSVFSDAKKKYKGIGQIIQERIQKEAHSS